jgi:hypothetical protein
MTSLARHTWHLTQRAIIALETLLPLALPAANA